MFVGRPFMPIEAHLCEDDMDCGGLSSRHLGEVDTGDPVEMGAEIKGGFVAVRLPMGRRRWGQGVGFRINQGLKGGEDALDFLIAGRDLLLGKVIQREGLFECEEMFGPVISLQRFGNGVLAGLNTIVAIRGSKFRITFSRHNGADNAHPRHAGHITHHVVQVEIHVIQRLVHVLNMLDRHPDEIVSMAEQTAELTHVLRRTKRRCEQAVTMQPLEPSTIKAIRLRAARDILDVARIDQGDGESAGLETLKQWNPVHPSGFHGDCGDTTGR